MPIPKSLEALMDHGVVEQVVRPLLSGKEAEVYLVVSEGAYRVAKVYKEAHNRTFKNRATYTEGRKVRNSRDQRAMAKRTSHGKSKDEAAWRSTEVDMIYKLEAAGVRVPKPYHFVDGILIMELVQTAEGEPAPRLGELELTASEAKNLYAALLAEVVRMLSAGVVHGDLSEFNVLLGSSGPCIIDFPQSVHAASNANARSLLLRDVSNLHRFVERFVPGRRAVPYGEEMWELYEKGELTPTTQLTGKYTPSTKPAEVDVVLAIIEEAKRDERIRQQRLGGETRGYSRKKSTALIPSDEAGHPTRDAVQDGHRSTSRGGRGQGDDGHAPRSGSDAGGRRGPSAGREGPSGHRPNRDGEHQGRAASRGPRGERFGGHLGQADRGGGGHAGHAGDRAGHNTRPGGGHGNRAGHGGGGQARRSHHAGGGEQVGHPGRDGAPRALAGRGAHAGPGGPGERFGGQPSRGGHRAGQAGGEQGRFTGQGPGRDRRSPHGGQHGDGGLGRTTESDAGAGRAAGDARLSNNSRRSRGGARGPHSGTPGPGAGDAGQPGRHPRKPRSPR